MSGSAILMALLTAAAAARAQTPSVEAFKVHVVNSISGAPIPGANVVLDGVPPKIWGKTDSTGLFEGKLASGGGLLVTVTHRGFRMNGGGMGKIVDMNALKDNSVTVEMLPLGTITGRVLDQFGDPLANALVRTQELITSQGEVSHYSSSAAATTNDLGEFRMSGVEPGKHYLAVEYSSEHVTRTTGRSSRNRWPLIGGLVLYPDAVDIDQAQQIEVEPGGTVRLEDIHLPIQRAVSIRGRVKPASTDLRQSLSLERQSKVALATAALFQSARPEADGTFKIDVLMPGKYTLSASDNSTGKVSAPLSIEVRDKDLADLVLELNTSYEVVGKFAVEGKASIDYSTLRLALGGPPITIGHDGTFRSDLPVNKSAFMLSGLADGWFLKSVIIGGKPVTGRIFDLQAGTNAALFTISPNGGTVVVRVESGGGASRPAFVVLLPDSGPLPDLQSLPKAQSDGSDTFTLRSVPPGTYRIFTLDASNWGLLMRPDVLLEKHRQLAPLLTVGESERKSITMQAEKITVE